MDSEDRQKLSLESQDRVCRESISKMGNMHIISNLEESKSAKAPGRPKFNEMCDFLEEGKAKYIICWQLNRLARNPIDGGRIIWLVQNHDVKIITPTKTYDINDLMLMYIEFAMSHQFINDLRKNTRRGLDEKVKRGKAPIKAPIGYYNDLLKHQGDRDILVDDKRYPLIRRMWDLILTGNYSVPTILDRATNKWGLRQRNGKPLSRTQAYRLFSNPFYTGTYMYRGKLHQGIHKQMVSKAEFESAQKILGRRNKMVTSKHDFAFTGSLIKCNCGSSITAHERIRKVCTECHLKYNAEKKP